MAQTQMQKTQAACRKSVDGGFSLMLENMKHWKAHGDWEPLAYTLVNHRDAPTLRRVAGRVINPAIVFAMGKDAKGSKWGASFTVPKGTNDLFVADKLTNLELLVSKRYGLRGKMSVKSDGKVKDVIAHLHLFPRADGSEEEKSFDPKAWAERAVKGHKASDIDQMIAALQAQRKTVTA
jgi:hypothetical protein